MQMYAVDRVDKCTRAAQVSHRSIQLHTSSQTCWARLPGNRHICGLLSVEGVQDLLVAGAVLLQLLSLAACRQPAAGETVRSVLLQKEKKNPLPHLGRAAAELVALLLWEWWLQGSLQQPHLLAGGCRQLLWLPLHQAAG